MTNADPQNPPAAPLASGARRWIYLILGVAFVVLAILGVVLPVLPTTPFLLLASFFFVRSSPAMHARLLRSRLFGPMLLDWQRKRGVRLHVKATAVGAIVVAVAASAYSGKLSPLLLWILFSAAAIGLFVVLRLPTVDE